MRDVSSDLTGACHRLRLLQQCQIHSGLAHTIADSIDGFWDRESLVHGQFWGKTDLDVDDILRAACLVTS